MIATNVTQTNQNGRWNILQSTNWTDTLRVCANYFVVLCDFRRVSLNPSALNDLAMSVRHLEIAKSLVPDDEKTSKIVLRKYRDVSRKSRPTKHDIEITR